MTGPKFVNVEFFESDFSMIPVQYVQPRAGYAGILDTRWMLVKLGFNRDFILEYLRAGTEDRKHWISMARQVSPGFQNRGHRRAVVRAFHAALEEIWRRGGTPRIELPIEVVRRLSDFSAS